MATAGSAVSSRERKWEEFRQTAQKVKCELGNKVQCLTKALKKGEEVCDEYFKKYGSERLLTSDTTKQPQNDLKQTVDALEENLQTAVSDDVTIVFVGPTSSGKSSLINALLRDDRLPTGSYTSTMCIFKVRPTRDKFWSVINTGNGTILSEGRDKEQVKKYLDALVDEDSEKKREEENISCDSVIQVNWPRDLCNLPEDIVLVDTPGLKENSKTSKATANIYKKADLIVGVMNIKSPSVENITDALNENEFQFKFGVFTKWDQDIPETDKPKRQRASEKHKEEFENSVKGEKGVYFVEAKNATVPMETAERNLGREEFLRFERDLAEKAKSVKARKSIILIKQVEGVASKYAEDFEKSKRVIDDKQKEREDRLKILENKISTMEKDHDSLDTVRQEVKHLDKLIRDLLSDEKIDRLIKELGEKINDCDSEESENLVVSNFFETKNCVISATLQQQILKVNFEFQEWKKALGDDYGCPQGTPSSYKGKQLEKTEDYGYNSSKDPHAYVTSNNLWAVMLGFATATAVTAATVAGPAAGAGAAVVVALETAGLSIGGKALAAAVGSLGFGTSLGFSKLMEKVGGLGVGQGIRKFLGPSKKKMDTLEKHMRESLKKLRAHFEKFEVAASDIVKQSSASISSHIKSETNRSSEEMSALKEELQQLKNWSQKLREITDRLQAVRKELYELKDGLKVNDTVPSDDQTENQSSVQTPLYEPYTVIQK